MREEVLRMDLREAYRILDLELGASRDAVRAARNVLVRVWHPDRHQQDPAVYAHAVQKTAHIHEAHDRIEAAGFPGTAAFQPSRPGTPALRREVALVRSPAPAPEPEVSFFRALVDLMFLLLLFHKLWDDDD